MQKMAQKLAFYISLLRSLCFLLALCHKYITPSGLRIPYIMRFSKKPTPISSWEGIKGIGLNK